MGNSSKQPQDYDIVSAYDSRQWIVKEQLIYCQIWTNTQLKTSAECYEIEPNLSPEELDKYTFRSQNNKDIVGVYHVIPEENEFLCAKGQKMHVLTQRIPIRFDSVQNLTEGEALHVLSSCYSGYNTIGSHYGPVMPEENCIGFTETGKAKVWINNYLPTNLPLSIQEITDSEELENRNRKYVRQIFSMVQRKTIGGLPRLREIFTKKQPTYFEALNILEHYTETTGIKVPPAIRPRHLSENAMLNEITQNTDHRVEISNPDQQFHGERSAISQLAGSSTAVPIQQAIENSNFHQSLFPQPYPTPTFGQRHHQSPNSFHSHSHNLNHHASARRQFASPPPQTMIRNQTQQPSFLSGSKVSQKQQTHQQYQNMAPLDAKTTMIGGHPPIMNHNPQIIQGLPTALIHPPEHVISRPIQVLIGHQGQPRIEYRQPVQFARPIPIMIQGQRPVLIQAVPEPPKQQQPQPPKKVADEAALVRKDQAVESREEPVQTDNRQSNHQPDAPQEVEYQENLKESHHQEENRQQIQIKNRQSGNIPVIYSQEDGRQLIQIESHVKQQIDYRRPDEQSRSQPDAPVQYPSQPQDEELAQDFINQRIEVQAQDVPENNYLKAGSLSLDNRANRAISSNVPGQDNFTSEIERRTYHEDLGGEIPVSRSRERNRNNALSREIEEALKDQPYQNQEIREEVKYIRQTVQIPASNPPEIVEEPQEDMEGKANLDSSFRQWRSIDENRNEKRNDPQQDFYMSKSYDRPRSPIEESPTKRQQRQSRQKQRLDRSQSPKSHASGRSRSSQLEIARLDREREKLESQRAELENLRGINKQFWDGQQNSLLDEREQRQKKQNEKLQQRKLKDQERVRQDQEEQERWNRDRHEREQNRQKEREERDRRIRQEMRELQIGEEDTNNSVQQVQQRFENQGQESSSFVRETVEYPESIAQPQETNMPGRSPMLQNITSVTTAYQYGYEDGSPSAEDRATIEYSNVSGNSQHGRYNRNQPSAVRAPVIPEAYEVDDIEEYIRKKYNIRSQNQPKESEIGSYTRKYQPYESKLVESDQSGKGDAEMGRHNLLTFMPKDREKDMMEVNSQDPKEKRRKNMNVEDGLDVSDMEKNLVKFEENRLIKSGHSDMQEHRQSQTYVRTETRIVDKGDGQVTTKRKYEKSYKNMDNPLYNKYESNQEETSKPAPRKKYNRDSQSSHGLDQYRGNRGIDDKYQKYIQKKQNLKASSASQRASDSERGAKSKGRFDKFTRASKSNYYEPTTNYDYLSSGGGTQYESKATGSFGKGKTADNKEKLTYEELRGMLWN